MRIEPRFSENPAPEAILALERVEKRYGAFRPALVGVDLRVARGEFVLVQGPGGSGKSVLLRLLAGIERPSSGILRIAGEDLAHMRPRARMQLRRSMGILPPGGGLLDRDTVLQNVALAAWVAGTGRDEGVRRARAALELVGVDVDRFGAVACAGLAGSERQCVALARALVNRPALLLLDDLFAPFDAAGVARIQRIVDQFSVAGVTVIAAQRAGPDAAQAAPTWPARARLLRLADGRIAA